MNALLALVIILPFLGFAMPLQHNNDASLRHLIDLLSQHEELRPCVNWIIERDVQFIPKHRLRDGAYNWGAVRPDIILTPPVINRDVASAAILFHEIKHLQGVADPWVYDYQWLAAKILKTPESHFRWIQKYAHWEPREIAIADLCKPVTVLQ